MVAVRYAVAIRRVMAPVVLVGIEPAVDVVDIVVAIDVDIDVMVIPVTIPPQRIDDRYASPESQAGGQCRTDGISR
ncbi:hypothetical protein D3C72_2309110 [compost metagenome]